MRHMKRAGFLRVGVAVILLIATVTLGVAGVTPTPAGAAVCDDGRGWTADFFQGGLCHHQNICAPESIGISITDRVNWSWAFPASCPMSAISAMGVVAERQIATSPDGNLAEGTTSRIEDHGVASPGRRSGGSVPVTCGEVELQFTVLAGAEVVATGSGHADTPPCTGTGGPTDPAGPTAPGLLGPWDGSTGDVASVARLYWAVFGRIPDAGGFAYWMARMDAGMSLDQVTRSWTDVTEWQHTYAGTDDPTFVSLVYLNVLGRPAEAAGFNYWVDRLGTDLSRDRLVLLFSDSREFRQRTNTD